MDLVDEQDRASCGVLVPAGAGAGDDLTQIFDATEHRREGLEAGLTVIGQ